MNKILILLLVVGYGVAGTEDYNYKCGQALFGNAWKSSLAESLHVDPRRITHWLDGTRPVPFGVWIDIKRLAEQRKQQIDELITKL